jgi:aminoglycoside phosphotransferase (APT) family kinase protein
VSADAEQLAPALLDAAAQALRAGAGTDLRATRIGGGGNNRVFRLEAGNESFVLKCYFQHPSDPRDRFRTERAFYEHLRAAGVASAPCFLAADETHRFTILELVAGSKLSPEQVTMDAVQQAVNFVVDANRQREGPSAAAIGRASEACFSLDEHLDVIARRVARLDQIADSDPLDREARAFAGNELQPAWQRLRERILDQARRDAIAPAAQLSPSQTCLSPSDFGFHNALRRGDGRLAFFDFEYAGWDDPAKLACDFFCQPQVPVPLSFREAFVGGLREGLGLDEAFERRARLLLPAYQVKWCCIMLNEFLPGDRQRRAFAQGDTALTERKQRQLGLARSALRQAPLQGQG